MTASQNLSIALPNEFDPLPALTTESIRAHLTAVRNHLAELRSNPRIVNEEGTVLDLLIGRIDNTPSNINRDYLLALLREATIAVARRESMNNDEAAYDDPVALSVTARQQLRMKQIRAERQMRLNWARTTQAQLEEAKEAQVREAAEREAVTDAIMGILDAGIDAIENEATIARAKATGTVVVPDMSKLVQNIMTLGTDRTLRLRPGMSM
ncbi:TPA: hypothetical protein QDB01_000403 [Burkholderia vietnamiensis]|nr:hypothetical protein [Burkholderia vietnamiensis]